MLSLACGTEACPTSISARLNLSIQHICCAVLQAVGGWWRRNSVILKRTECVKVKLWLRSEVGGVWAQLSVSQWRITVHMFHAAIQKHLRLGRWEKKNWGVIGGINGVSEVRMIFLPNCNNKQCISVGCCFCSEWTALTATATRAEYKPTMLWSDPWPTSQLLSMAPQLSWAEAVGYS